MFSLLFAVFSFFLTSTDFGPETNISYQYYYDEEEKENIQTVQNKKLHTFKDMLNKELENGASIRLQPFGKRSLPRLKWI